MAAPQTRCPTCDATLVTDDPQAAVFRPFCSKRCQLLDLAKWFDEEYRISVPAPPADPSADAAN